MGTSKTGTGKLSDWLFFKQIKTECEVITTQPFHLVPYYSEFVRGLSVTRENALSDKRKNNQINNRYIMYRDLTETSCFDERLVR